MKLAIFGGSFDPPHLGHYFIVKQALTKLNIDKIIIVPTFRNPWKKNFLAPPNLRFNWIKTIFQNSKFNSKIEISDFEIQNGRPTFAFETVRALSSLDDEVFLIIGADNLQKLHLWDNFEEINSRVTFVIATRNNITIPNNFIKLNVKHSISSTDLRENITINSQMIPEHIRESVINFYKEKNE
jgi:nicotinate-nucleotide adenylyltransferase